MKPTVPFWRILAQHKFKKGQVLAGHFSGSTRAEVVSRFKAEHPEYEITSVTKMKDT